MNRPTTRLTSLLLGALTLLLPAALGQTATAEGLGPRSPAPDVVPWGDSVTAVPQVSDLAALDTASVRWAVVHADEGRDGSFAFQSGDYTSEVASDPQSGVFVVADDTPVSAGAWVRQDAARPDARWFGASPAATPADNRVALQAWLDFLAAHRNHGQLPAGTYSFDSPLRIAGGGVSVSGAGRAASVLHYTSQSGDALTVGTGTGTSLADVHLRDLGIRGSGAATSGAALALEVSQRVVVERLALSQTFDGVSVDGAESFRLVDIRISDLEPLGDGVHIDSTQPGATTQRGHLERVVVQGFAPPNPPTGFRVRDARSLVLRDCRATLCLNGFWLDPSVSDTVEDVRFLGCHADSNDVGALIRTGTSTATIRNVAWLGGSASHCSFAGIEIYSFAEPVAWASVVGAQLVNNGYFGLRAANVAALSVSSCHLLGNSWNNPGFWAAIELSDLGGRVSGVVQGNRGGPGAGYATPSRYGVQILGDGYPLIITGNDFSGNAFGTINSPIAANSIIQDNL